ncbi:MAG: ribosome silencing factor [Deltaproteobacteria bacterium]|nr:ribosome silencing factor [Deltaproteobacteria bacterium]
MEALELGKALSTFAIEKKARQARLLDVGKLSSYTDYILIVSATSDRHACALAEYLIEQLKRQKVRPLGAEGQDGGQWILLDYGVVIVHIFLESIRDYYDLDGLWTDAKSLPLEDNG